MANAITMQQLIDASLDTDALEIAVNGADTEDVQTRLNKTYPTLAKAIKTIMQKAPINSTPFATKSALLADTTLADNAFAFVYNDTDANNGLYQKVDGAWEQSTYPLQNLKDYTDAQLTKLVGINSDNLITLASATTPIADWSGFGYAFAFPFTLTETKTANQITLRVGQNDTTNKTLKVTLRDSTTSGTVLKTITKSSTELFGTSTALTDITLDFDSLQINANQTIYVVLEMLNVNNQQTLINTKTASGSVTAKYNTSSGGGWVNAMVGEQPYFILASKSKKTVLDTIAEAQANTLNLQNSFNTYDDIIASNTFNRSFWLDAAFTGWAVGVKPDRAVKPSVFAPVLFGLDKIYKLNLKVYQRTTANADAAPMQTSDNKILDKDYIVADVLNPKVNDWSHFDFDISSIDTMQSDSVYVFVITAYNSSNARVSVGGGQATTQNMQQYNLGWYEQNSSNSYVANNTYALAYNLYAKQYQAKSDNVLLQSVDATFNRYQQFSVNIPHLKLNLTYNDIVINNQTIAIDAPQSSSIGETVTLKYSSHERGLVGVALKYQYVSNVSVSDGSTTLVQGVDYAIKPNTGRIYGLKNIADKQVTVTYRCYNHRYDLIVVNRQSGALSVIKGTERNIDPENYQPVVSNGNIELFLVYVTVNGCELLPVYRYRDYLPLDYTEQFYAMMRHSKLCVSKTMAKLYQKQAIKIIGYGDSITAQGDGWGDSALISGGNRDRVYILERIPQDTIASQITLYDGTDPDFLGSPYNDHVKIGWNWVLKSALEQTYGVSVTYHNRGIGGSSSSNHTFGNGVLGGLNSQRLNAMLDDGGDLLVLAFGMNELGSTGTYANCRSIIEQFKARTGGDVVVVTTPMINKWGGASREEDWLYTHDELVRCAIDTQSAYVSTYLLEHSDFAGNNRLSEQNMCNDNLYNHPTHYQLKHIGNMLSLIFKPA